MQYYYDQPSYFRFLEAWLTEIIQSFNHVHKMDEEREVLSDHEFSDPDDYVDKISDEGTFKFK